MKKPNFYIVGAPKCGTSAMNDYLSQHPDVFMAKKELHFFGKDLKAKIKLTELEYVKHFENVCTEKVVGEASVWYLFSNTAAEEIKTFSPNAKILIMLRNPVDLMQSLHSQHLYDGNEDVLDFETAVNLDEERKKGNLLPDSVDYYQLPPYLDSVLFYEKVKRFLDVFGHENICIILYDDLKKGPKEEVAKVFQFLKLDTNIEINYEVVNPNKRIQSFYLHRLIKKPGSKLKTLVRLMLPFKNLRHAVMAKLLERNIAVQKRNEINSDLRESLKQKVAPDVNALGKLIGRDLSMWMK